MNSSENTGDEPAEWERAPGGGWQRRSLTEELRASVEAGSKDAELVQSNRELLERQETNRELLARSYDQALERFPELKSVAILPKTDSTPGVYARHQFHQRNTSGKPELHMDMAPGSDDRLFTSLQARPKSLEMIAKTIDIPTDQLTPQLVQAFALLHELGHTLDYIRTVKTPQDGKQRDTRRRDEMQRLPIRNVAPVQLLDRRIQEQLLASYPDLFAGLSRAYGIEVKSMQDVIDLQEAHYRALPSESYADQFAGAILTNRPFEQASSNFPAPQPTS